MSDPDSSDTNDVAATLTGVQPGIQTSEKHAVPKPGFRLNMPVQPNKLLDKYASNIQRSEPLVLARLTDVNFISGILHALQKEIGTRHNRDKLIYYADAANAELSQRSHSPEMSEVVEHALNMYKAEMDTKYAKFRMTEHSSSNYLLAGSSMKQPDQQSRDQCEDDVTSKGIYALQQIIHSLKEGDRRYVYIGTVPTGSINEKGHAIVDTYLIRQLCSDSTGIRSCAGYLLNEVPVQESEGMKRYSLSNQGGNVVLTEERDVLQIFQYTLSSTNTTKATLFQSVQGVLTVSDALRAITNGIQQDFEITTDQTQKYLQNSVLNQFDDTIQSASKMAMNAMKRESQDELHTANEQGWKVMRESKDKDVLLATLLRNGRPFTSGDIEAKCEAVRRIVQQTYESNSDIFFEVFYQLVVQKLEAVIGFQQELQRNIMDGSFVDIGLVPVKSSIHDRLRCMPYQSYLNFRVKENPPAWCLVQHGVDESENKGTYQVWDITDNSNRTMSDNAYKLLGHSFDEKVEGMMHAVRLQPMKLSGVVRHIRDQIRLNDTFDYMGKRGRGRVNSVHVLGIDNTKFAADDELFRGTRFAVLSLNDGEDMTVSARLISKYENEQSKGFMGRRVRKMFTTAFNKIQRDEAAIKSETTMREKTKNVLTDNRGKLLAGTTAGAGLGWAYSAGALGALTTTAGIEAGAMLTFMGVGLPWMTVLGAGALVGAGAIKAYDWLFTDHQMASAELKQFYTNPSPKIMTKNDVTGSLQQELREMNRNKYEKFFEAMNQKWSKAVEEAALTTFEREWLGALQENIVQMKTAPAWDAQVNELARKACVSLGITGDELEKPNVAYLDGNFKENMLRHAGTLHEASALFAQVQALRKLLEEDWVSWLNKSATSDMLNEQFDSKVRDRGTQLLAEELNEVLGQCSRQFDDYFQNIKDFRQTTQQKWEADHPYLSSMLGRDPRQVPVQVPAQAAPVPVSQAAEQTPAEVAGAQVQAQQQAAQRFGHLL